MQAKVDLLKLKEVVDKMVDDHLNRRDGMSNRVSIVSDDHSTLYLRQHCEYPDCFPNVQSIPLL